MAKDIKNKRNTPKFVRSYDLKSNPFHLDPEQRYFYINSTLGQRLDFLNRLVKSDDFLILVIGEEGAGKTTLLNHFLSKASDKWRSCKITASPGSESVGDFENLKGHPAFILQNEELPVIMLDNAHELSIDELAFLIELAGKTVYTSKLKRVVLFCEPQIQVKLSDLSQKVSDEGTINKIYIPQLTQKDTKEYLAQRLEIAGFKGKLPFSSGEIAKIYKKSGGIPKKINEEATLCLDKKADKNLMGKFRNAGLVAASFFVAVVLSVILLKENTVIKEKGITVNVQSPVTELKKDYNQKNRIEKNRAEKKIIESVEKKVSDPGNVIETAKKPIVVKKPEIRKPAIVKRKDFKRDTLKKLRREKWLLSQKPTHYTLQLLGVRKKESLTSFIGKHKVQNFAYFHTFFKNKDWYPLLYGIYPTFKDATRAIKKLPKEFQAFSPWVRQMSSVHRAIKTKKTAFGSIKSIALNVNKE